MKGFASGAWTSFAKNYSHAPVETGVATDTLHQIAKQIASVPDGFTIHPKLKDILGARRDAVLSGKPLDWGTGESLAYG